MQALRPLLLRDEQERAVQAMIGHALTAVPGPQAGMAVVSPTGTGKSYLLAEAHRRLTLLDKLVYTTFPSHEIAAGVWGELHGVAPDTAKQKVMEADGFWTIKRLHNELLAARVAIPDVLVDDECHHGTDDTHVLVHGVCGFCPHLGTTATDYRGTPAETQKFRQTWNKQYRVLTLAEAVRLGRLSQPTWTVWPLLNDELIDVTNGEFSVSSVESHLRTVLADVVDRVGAFYSGTSGPKPGAWDRPTMIAVSSVGAVEALVAALNTAGYPAVGVTGETPAKTRTEHFAACIGRRVILVQIRVVGEGVDLPIRRLIDLAPTTSPVLWMQRVGRITRPVGADECAPEYIACCHNLSRHAYLWYGVMPVSAIAAAQKAWGDDFKPSKRFLARAVDVEGLGRFQPAAVPLANGTTATLYVMTTRDGLAEYAVMLHPLRPEPWFFARENVLTGERKSFETDSGHTVEYNEKEFGKWEAVAKLPDVRGCHSIKLKPLTPAQASWWKKPVNEKRFGLATTAEITNREFAALPILSNSGVRLEV